ncbi:hypothetical protein HanIR_Chr01g0026751 [Helianthus annuus]|nr:hypothetical protein HanIR_Chr01g0026751 [Helianthus annuus]
MLLKDDVLFLFLFFSRWLVLFEDRLKFVTLLLRLDYEILLNVLNIWRSLEYT